MTQQEQKGLFEFSELTDEGDTELTYEGDINELKAQGLKYVPNFLSPEEQRSTLKCIDDEPWLKDLSRRVQHYGYRYDYRARRVDKSMRIGVLPPWAKEISEHLKGAGYFRLIPDQAIINEYLKGQGISPHIDCVPCFGDTLASLSLNSSAVMKFTHQVSKGKKVDLLLEKGSLVVLHAEARYNWVHSIPARKSDDIAGRYLTRDRRVSLTFRNVILE